MGDSQPINWRRLAMIGGLVALVAAVLALMTVAPSDAQAAGWHTKLSGSGHHSKTTGPAKLWSGRSTRLRYWTARVWDVGDDGDEPGEWEYDWVKFKLIRTDTGKVVRSFGPYHRPTGLRDWRTVSVRLPAGGHPYKLRAICDDARFAFKVQQKY